MKNVYSILLFFITFSLQSCGSAVSASDEKSTLILNNYQKALGGNDKINAIENFQSNGKWQGFDGTQEYIVEIPNKLYINMKSTSIHETTIFNDGKLKMTSDSLDVSESFTHLIKEFELDAWVNPVAHTDKLAKKITYLGGTKTDEINCDKIEIEFNNGLIWIAEFDKKTSLLTSIKRTEIKITFSDYREINGVKFPFHFTYHIPNGQKMIFETTSIKCNETLKENQFKI